MTSINPLISNISIIIPARNEADNLDRLAEELLPSAVSEIILCDGQSTDNTAALAKDLGMRVVSSPPGRGIQLNRGAAEAKGDILFFLHCDTIPPHDFAQHIRTVLARPGVAAGAFGLTLDAPGRPYRTIEWGVRMRNKLLGMVYGDQGLFLFRKIFEQVGGFPAQPLLEDYELIRRLRRLGSVVVAPASVRTSARRWQTKGPLRTTIINQLMIMGYHLGIEPAKLAQFYYGGGNCGSKSEKRRVQGMKKTNDM